MKILGFVKETLENIGQMQGKTVQLIHESEWFLQNIMPKPM